MKNKSIFLIYEAVNCMPNGDPDTAQQRYDENQQKALVSDLRIKRFCRDRLNEFGKDVYYFYDINSKEKAAGKGTGAEVRFETFCKKNNIDTKDSNTLDIMLDNFIDVRIFGGILTKKGTGNSVNITGALQYNAENVSVNDIVYGNNLINRGITMVFPSTSENDQGSMGRDSYIKYGLFCINGRFSATVANKNKATDDDLKLALLSTYDGIKNINTRSKFGHVPVACIVVEHPSIETKNGTVGKIFDANFKPFTIEPKENKTLSDIYSSDDYTFNFDPLINAAKTNVVESVTIYSDNDNLIENYFNNLSNKFTIKNPFDELLKLI